MAASVAHEQCDAKARGMRALRAFFFLLLFRLDVDTSYPFAVFLDHCRIDRRNIFHVVITDFPVEFFQVPTRKRDNTEAIIEEDHILALVTEKFRVEQIRIRACRTASRKACLSSV